MAFYQNGFWKFLCIIIYLDSFLILGSSYTNYHLDDDKICRRKSFLKVGEVNIGKDEESAVIIDQKNYFKDFSGNYEFKCAFVVKAAFNHGIFAVIQRMNLRRNLTTNECIDYVQLCKHDTTPPEKVLGINLLKCQTGPKHCGTIDSPFPVQESFPITTIGYQEPSGDLGVKIHLDNKPVKLIDEELDLVIAFTAYKTCSSDIGSYKMCSKDPKVLSGAGGACIYKEYFNDGILNCPYEDCADECGSKKKDDDFQMNSKVTVTAVTSVFLSFFLFLGCIWVCRYFEVLCWSVQNLRSSTNTRRRSSETNAENLFPPSAPSLPQNSPDKDLPPSYETLFPDR